MVQKVHNSVSPCVRLRCIINYSQLLNLEKYVGPVPTYGAAVRLELHNPNANSHFGPFDQKISIPVTPAVGDVHKCFVFMSFVFESEIRTGQTKGRTHRRTGNTVRYCGLLRRPHNDVSYNDLFVITSVLRSKLCLENIFDIIDCNLKKDYQILIIFLVRIFLTHWPSNDHSSFHCNQSKPFLTATV